MATDPWGRPLNATVAGGDAGREARAVATVIRVTTSRDRDGRVVASLYLKNPVFGLAVASSPHGPQAPFRASEAWVAGVCAALDVDSLGDLGGSTITVLVGSRPGGDFAVTGVAGVNGTYLFSAALQKR